jgi:MFS family permease
MVFAAGGALAIDLAPAPRRAEAVGYFGSAMLCTNAFGPALAEAFAASHSWELVFAGCSACCALALLCVAKLEPPAFTRSVGSLFRIPFSVPLTGAYLASLAVGVAVGSSKTFLPAAMVEEGAARVAPYFWAYVAGALLQRTVFGSLPDRLGRLRATILALLVYGGALVVIAVVPLHLMVWCAAVLGFAHGAAYPASVALASDLSEPQFLGRVTALSAGCFNLGLGLSSSGLALLEPRLGYRGLVIVGGVLVAGAGVFVPRLVRARAATSPVFVPR